MPHLFNPNNITLHGQYGGVQYLFPPNTRVTIKSKRMPDEVHVAEDIASKLYADLSGMGLILLDDENPIPLDEAKQISRRNLMAFIQQLIDDFNDLNASQAEGGGKILRVPKHYRELKNMLDELRAEEGEDDEDGGFLGKERLESIRERGDINRDLALRSILKAVETDDPGTVMAAARAALKNTSTGTHSVERQQQEEGFVTRAAHGRGAASRGRKPGGRRGRPPKGAAAAGGDGGE